MLEQHVVAHGVYEGPEPFGLPDPVSCANQRQYANKGFLRDIFDRLFGTQSRTQFEPDEFAEVGRKMPFGAHIAALQTLEVQRVECHELHSGSLPDCCWCLPLYRRSR